MEKKYSLSLTHTRMHTNGVLIFFNWAVMRPVRAFMAAVSSRTDLVVAKL